MDKSLKTNGYINQFAPWRPGYFIFETVTVAKRTIAMHALQTTDDDELACSMKQLTAVNVVDKALKEMMV